MSELEMGQQTNKVVTSWADVLKYYSAHNDEIGVYYEGEVWFGLGNLNALEVSELLSGVSKRPIDVYKNGLNVIFRYTE